MLEYRRRIELVRSPNQPRENLSMGSIMHLCADDFWNGKDAMQRLLDIEQEVIALVEGPLSKEWVDIFRYLRSMVGHYKNWLESGITMQEKVIASEKIMSVAWGEILGYDVVLTGKLDRLVQDLFTDTYGIGDLKTTQSFRRGMTHHFQLLTYALMLLVLEGITVERLFTEQVKKVLGTGTAKPPFVERIEMFVNDEMIENQRRYIDARLRDMVPLVQQWDALPEEEAMKLPGFYPNPTGDCSWDCEFLPICAQMDDGSDYEYTIETIYRRKPSEDTYL